MGPDKSWKGGITCPSHQAATIITGLWVHCQLEWQLKPGSSCGRWLGSREAGGAGTEASPQALSISSYFSLHISVSSALRSAVKHLLIGPGELNDGAERRTSSRKMRGRQHYLFIIEWFTLGWIKQHKSGEMAKTTRYLCCRNLLMKIANK